ncbi:hypothetical protein IWQ56_002196 [Coemansia nantahalensis]|nr:hypothetical protein IWQ56_002196 [Coemansia nantahalensis]
MLHVSLATNDEPTAAVVEDLERRLRAAETARVAAEETAADAVDLADEVYGRMRAAEDKAAAAASKIAKLEALVEQLSRQLHAAPAAEPTGAMAGPTQAVVEPTGAVTEPTGAVTEPTGAASSGPSDSEAHFAFGRRNSARTLVPSDEQRELRCHDVPTRVADKGKGRAADKVPPQHTSFEAEVENARILEPEILQERLRMRCAEKRQIHIAVTECFQRNVEIWKLLPMKEVLEQSRAIRVALDGHTRRLRYLAHKCRVYRAALGPGVAPAA